MVMYLIGVVDVGWVGAGVLSGSLGLFFFFIVVKWEEVNKLVFLI